MVDTVAMGSQELAEFGLSQDGERFHRFSQWMDSQKGIKQENKVSSRAMYDIVSATTLGGCPAVLALPLRARLLWPERPRLRVSPLRMHFLRPKGAAQ